uniref:Putative secreted protein n=1 Tax=Ixodes ricinus TaxID=34613 RepID=A0A147BFQ1_IXORI
MPFSKMQIVVFAVVLMLPALQNEGSLSGAVIHDDCSDIIDEAGEKKCGLEGSGGFRDIDPTSCTLKCSGNERPKLPKEVCSNGELVRHEEIFSLPVRFLFLVFLTSVRDTTTPLFHLLKQRCLSFTYTF